MKEVKVDAGIIRYIDQGEGQPILFLHGALSNSNTWRKVIPVISRHYRCIVPDLPLGAHSIPLNSAADLTPRGIASLIKQFIDEIGTHEVVVVGNDTGGAYGQVFTTMYPSSVVRLVLCNTDAFEIFPPKAFAALQAGINVPGFTWLMSRLFHIKPFLKSPMALGLLSHSLTKEQLSELYIRSFIVQKGVRSDFVKVAKGWSPEITLQAAQKLTHFHQPVLVLWGTDDEKLFPLELGHRVFRIFPNASLKLVEGSLTYVQEDQPDIFASELLRFMAA
ncbi:alpha/beta fold hydrolase [Paenibacillus sp. CAU 1782]